MQAGLVVCMDVQAGLVVCMDVQAGLDVCIDVQAGLDVCTDIQAGGKNIYHFVISRIKINKKTTTTTNQKYKENFN